MRPIALAFAPADQAKARDLAAALAARGAMIGDDRQATAALVVLLSAASNTDPGLVETVRRASTAQQLILPVRLDPTASAMAPELELALAGRHWIEGGNADLEALAAQLARAVSPHAPSPAAMPSRCLGFLALFLVVIAAGAAAWFAFATTAPDGDPLAVAFHAQDPYRLDGQPIPVSIGAYPVGGADLGGAGKGGVVHASVAIEVFSLSTQGARSLARSSGTMARFQTMDVVPRLLVCLTQASADAARGWLTVQRFRLDQGPDYGNKLDSFTLTPAGPVQTMAISADTPDCAAVAGRPRPDAQPIAGPRRAVEAGNAPAQAPYGEGAYCRPQALMASASNEAGPCRPGEIRDMESGRCLRPVAMTTRLVLRRQADGDLAFAYAAWTGAGHHCGLRGTARREGAQWRYLSNGAADAGCAVVIQIANGLVRLRVDPTAPCRASCGARAEIAGLDAAIGSALPVAVTDRLFNLSETDFCG